MRRALADVVEVCASLLLAGLLAVAEPPPPPRRAAVNDDGSPIWADS